MILTCGQGNVSVHQCVGDVAVHTQREDAVGRMKNATIVSNADTLGRNVPTSRSGELNTTSPRIQLKKMTTKKKICCRLDCTIKKL